MSLTRRHAKEAFHVRGANSGLVLRVAFVGAPNRLMSPAMRTPGARSASSRIPFQASYIPGRLCDRRLGGVVGLWDVTFATRMVQLAASAG